MPLKVKICGITERETLEAAGQAGAYFAGFVFFPPSPRNVTPDQAAALAREAGRMKLVGVFVDPDDGAIKKVLEKVSLNFIQLHGHESPGRVREIREKFDTPVIKAIPVATGEDIKVAHKYQDCADVILFDAAARKDDLLPGGNARAFDHTLLNGKEFDFPWGLSGGLNAANLEEAIMASGARMVDVSSGVEQKPGQKDSNLITAFLEKAKTL